jgi:ABC-type bacteriocin/lantibiotic exporter with double-glycine peptidase domain
MMNNLMYACNKKIVSFIIIAVTVTVLLPSFSNSQNIKTISEAHRILEKDPSAGKIIDVPFIKQKRFDCGPASVAMVINYYGIDADAEKIAKDFENENVVGTFTVDLLIAASEAGLDAHWVEGDIGKIKKEINAGRSVIVFLNLLMNPLPRRHFAVVVGYLSQNGKDYVILHSGETPYQMMPEKKFSKYFRRTGRMMMTAEKREKEKSKDE